MLVFDNERSLKLDEEIINTLSRLVKSQQGAIKNEDKIKFLLKERKVIYEVFMKVNEERQVLSLIK